MSICVTSVVRQRENMTQPSLVAWLQPGLFQQVFTMLSDGHTLQTVVTIGEL